LLRRADLLDPCRRRPGVALSILATLARRVRRLGTVRGLVARAFSQLEASGIIRRTRRVVIRDPARLAAPARGEPMSDAQHQRVT
jgi:hypothetical protein